MNFLSCIFYYASPRFHFMPCVNRKRRILHLKKLNYVGRNWQAELNNFLDRFESLNYYGFSRTSFLNHVQFEIMPHWLEQLFSVLCEMPLSRIIRPKSELYGGSPGSRQASVLREQSPRSETYRFRYLRFRRRTRRHGRFLDPLRI